MPGLEFTAGRVTLSAAVGNFSIVIEAIPAVLAAARWRRTSDGFRMVGLLFSVMVLQDLLMWLIAQMGHHNLVVAQLGNPVQTVLWLLAFSYFADSAVAARALRFAAVFYVVIWAIVSFTREDWSTFGHFTLPLQAIVIMAVAAWFIVRCAASSTTPLWRSGVFWFSIGTLLYFGPVILLGPVARLVMPARPELIRKAFMFKNIIAMIAYLVVAYGVVCQQKRSTSGGSSSREAWAP